MAVNKSITDSLHQFINKIALIWKEEYWYRVKTYLMHKRATTHYCWFTHHAVYTAHWRIIHTCTSLQDRQFICGIMGYIYVAILYLGKWVLLIKAASRVVRNGVLENIYRVYCMCGMDSLLMQFRWLWSHDVSPGMYHYTGYSNVTLRV